MVELERSQDCRHCRYRRPVADRLLATVAFVRLTVPLTPAMPPPIEAELAERVVYATVKAPLLLMPPPSPVLPPWLDEIVVPVISERALVEDAATALGGGVRRGRFRRVYVIVASPAFRDGTAGQRRVGAEAYPPWR